MALSPPNSARGGYPLSLPGATAATRYVGATTTGAPASGTFAVGDFVVTQDGSLYVCTVAGSPGTWAQVSGSGGGSNPVRATFGAPATAFDFDTSSLSGLTAVGTITTEDANTSAAGCYYGFQAADATFKWGGRSAAAPSAPFTVITCLADINPLADYNTGGLFIGVDPPGNMDICLWGANDLRFEGQRATPTAFGATFLATTFATRWQPPMYLAFRVNSATDVDMLVSFSGRVWYKVVDSRNPGITIGTVGLLVKSENVAAVCGAAFDFLYIYTSALTMPGAVA